MLSSSSFVLRGRITELGELHNVPFAHTGIRTGDVHVIGDRDMKRGSVVCQLLVASFEHSEVFPRSSTEPACPCSGRTTSPWWLRQCREKYMELTAKARCASSGWNVFFLVRYRWSNL